MRSWRPPACGHRAVQHFPIVSGFPSCGSKGMAGSFSLPRLAFAQRFPWLGGTRLCPGWIWTGFESRTFEQRPKPDPEVGEVLLSLEGWPGCSECSVALGFQVNNAQFSSISITGARSGMHTKESCIAYLKFKFRWESCIFVC